MQTKRTRRPSVSELNRRSRGRKRASLLLAVALAGVLAVGGTAAYLTDRSAEVENAFAPSEVTCSVAEDFDKGDKIKEDVRVENTGDVDAYIRVAVVANWVPEDAEGNSVVLGKLPMLDTDYSLAMTGDWTLGSDGYYYCKTSVPANAGDDSLTPVLFTECEVLGDAPEEGYVLSLDILASAIQAEPDQAVVDAWGVTVTTAADGSKTISKPAASGEEGENA